MGVRRAGTVRWFKDEKGYGPITADDGEVLFVHFSAIELDGYRVLGPGQRVTFVWNGSHVDHGTPQNRSGRPRLIQGTKQDCRFVAGRADLR
jgi:cold shock protein